MEIRFAKYQGTGNDFLLVREPEIGGVEPALLARALCARTTGLGADGLLLVREDPLEMMIYNSDGSRAPMCGNGIRCFAAWCSDEGVSRADVYPVLTGAGEMTVAVLERSPFFCEIEMGKPDYAPAAAGILDTADADFLRKTLYLPDGRKVVLSSFFMGTYHTVVWLDENRENGAPDIRDDAGLEAFGRLLHELPLFTKKTNVDMGIVTGPDTIVLRTYERGAGMTAACGTGACAAAAAAYREGLSVPQVSVQVSGGILKIRVAEDETIFMSGPAMRIARGVCYY
ncbi:MAG: diaminopimelate epimerase [Clostridiales Family XIII bacterium]|jgi:diaminopimelate epimerase|nr:diaminopimelate epimerase [Clostridiales Family XIII bacterium]